MNIQILITNVGRSFKPEAKQLDKLLKLVNKLYHCPVELVFETATRFRSKDGFVLPVDQVKVEVTPINLERTRRNSLPADFSRQAGEINSKILDLLLSSQSSELNLPSKVQIQAAGKTYKFSGMVYEGIAPEWRD